jgi:hypothetical protein
VLYLNVIWGMATPQKVVQRLAAQFVLVLPDDTHLIEDRTWRLAFREVLLDALGGWRVGFHPLREPFVNLGLTAQSPQSGRYHAPTYSEWIGS